MEPAEVRHALHGDVAEATLQRVVRQVRADPAWSVGPSVKQPTAHILRFVYRPQQLADEFHALRAHPDRWHIVPSQPRPAARPEQADCSWCGQRSAPRRLRRPARRGAVCARVKRETSVVLGA